MVKSLIISRSNKKFTSALLAGLFLISLFTPSAFAEASNLFVTSNHNSLPSPSVTENDPPSGLEVISSDSQNLVLQITTPEFQIVQEEIGGNSCQSIAISGFSETEKPGWPRLPIRGKLIGIPETSKPSLSILDSELETVPGTYNICPVKNQNFEHTASGEIVYKGSQTIQDPQIYSSDSFIPEKAAEIVSTARLRSQRVAQLRLQPFQYNPTSGELRYLKHMTVRVSYDLNNPQLASPQQIYQDEGVFEPVLKDNLINYETSKTWRSSINNSSRQQTATTYQSQTGAKLLVDRDGIYQISYSEFESAGVPVLTLDPRNLSVFTQGEAIGIHVTGEEDGSFDPGDNLLFYGQAGTSKYSTQNVYWLNWEDATGLRMEHINGAPQSETPTDTSYRNTHHLEQDKLYISSLPSGEEEDHWYWEYIQASGHATNRNFNFHLENLSPESDLATLRGFLKGYSASPEHHTEIYLNGKRVYEAKWFASAEHLFEVDFPQTYLQSGENTLTVNVPLDNGITYETFYVNWFEVETQQTYNAIQNQLIFESQETEEKTVSIDGFSTPNLAILEISTAQQPKFITGYKVEAIEGKYRVNFELEDGVPNRYAAQNISQSLVPQIVLDATSNLHSSSNGADYIILTHKDFMNAANTLANFRLTQKLRINVVDVNDVYDEFNDGELDPQAIHDFLAYAYANWQPPAPSFVVLMGDGNYDFKNNLGYGDTNFIPPYLDDVDPFIGETASDNRYVCVSGDDTLPDMYIGRLPVGTSEEAEALVSKIINYETNPDSGDWNKQVLFAADNTDAAGDFAAYSEQVANQALPASFLAEKVYYGQTHTTPEDVRNSLQEALDSGVLLVNYVGHATRQYLAAERFITSGEVGELTNGKRQPFWATFGCLSGYFIEPNTHIGDNSSFGEKVVRVTEKGAIASWSATGLGLATGQDYLNHGLYEAIFEAGILQVGPATAYAKLYLYSETSSYIDLIDTYTLFGDPATQLNIPEADITVDLKATPGGFIQAGQSITYTLTYANNGGRPASEIVIQEILSTGLENSEIFFVEGNNPSLQENQFVWEISEIKAGQSGTISISGQINDDFQGMISNKVTITSSSNDVNLENNTAGPLETLVLSRESSALYLPFVSGNQHP